MSPVSCGERGSPQRSPCGRGAATIVSTGWAIRAVARGAAFLQPSIAGKVIAEFARLSPYLPPQAQPLVEPLSERELDILRLLSQGASNKEIADDLVITVGTVKNHVTSILAKLGVRDRTQAALKAKELGIM